jgi:pentatricopeptide repeat protein
LAEKIIATKRTLRSISDGRGSARVARMFEAAEQGNDFLLDSAPARRRRRGRRHASTVAQLRDEEDIDSLQQKLAAIPGQVKAAKQRRRLSEKTTTVSDAVDDASTRSANAARLISSYEPPAKPPGDRDRNVRFVRTFQKRRVLIEDESSRTPVKHPTWARTKQLQASRSIDTASLADPESGGPSLDMGAADRILQASLMQHKSSDFTVHHRSPQGVIASEEHAGSDAQHTFEDLVDKPAEQSSLQSAMLAPTDPEISSLEPGVGSLDTDNETYASPLFPALSTLERPKPETASIVPYALKEAHSVAAARPRPSDLGKLLGPAITSPAALLADPSSDHKVWDAGRHAMEGKDQELITTWDDPNPSDAQFNAVVEKHLASETALGLQQAEEFFHRSYLPARHGIMPAAATQLIHRFLATESTHRQAFRIFGQVPAAKRHTAFHSFICARRVMQYMLKFCMNGTVPSVWIAEYYKIADIVKGAGLPLHGKSAETLLRALCSVGQTVEAEAVYEDMVANYGMARALQSDRVLAIGYAMQHDWTSVNRIMARLQEEGVPRSRPSGYSITFQKLFRIHLRHHSLDASYEYLINAMGYWKLVPNNAISSILITACIRARRYEHIQEWLETVRQMWPRLAPVTNFQLFAYQVSRAWAETGASCMDIRSTCQVLGQGSLIDPFSRSFRSIAREAMCSALQSAYKGAFDGLKPIQQLEPDRFDQAIERVTTSLRDFDRQGGFADSRHTALEYLGLELSAAQDFQKIMRGHGSSMSGPRTEAAEMPSVDRSSYALQDSSAVEQAVIESKGWLVYGKHKVSFIAERYAESFAAGRAPPHDVLTAVVEEMVLGDELVEAVKLIRTVHSSGYITGRNGRFFDGSVYTKWLELCVTVGSYLESTVAMWALLDASRSVTITAEHMILVTNCSLSLYQPATQHHSNFVEAKKEMDYLHRRLARVRWMQRGARPRELGDRVTDPGLIDEWQTWQQQVKNKANWL